MDNKVTVLQIKKPELCKVPHLTQGFSPPPTQISGRKGRHLLCESQNPN